MKRRGGKEGWLYPVDVTPRCWFYVSRSGRSIYVVIDADEIGPHSQRIQLRQILRAVKNAPGAKKARKKAGERVKEETP